MICSVAPCGRKVSARGLCAAHVHRLYAGAEIDTQIRRKVRSHAPLTEEARSAIDELTACRQRIETRGGREDGDRFDAAVERVVWHAGWNVAVTISGRSQSGVRLCVNRIRNGTSRTQRVKATAPARSRARAR